MRPASLLLCGLAWSASVLPAEEKIPVKVVVVTMFELGEDSKDKPGEFQFWVERLKLDRKIPAPSAYRDLRGDGRGVIAMVTGMGDGESGRLRHGGGQRSAI